MPTQTKENYLKALYHLHIKGEDITITSLGKQIGVSKPTVNDMVKKLQANGWVKYEKYKPLQLTKAGQNAAALIVRKHRLSEMFLSQVMGFGWEEVHDTAEELEHVKSDLFFDRMDEILGFPTKDPHGSIIPDKDGNTNTIEYQLLSQVDSGKKVIFKALRESSAEFLKFLNKRDLALNIEIEIHAVEAFDQSRIVSYGDQKEVVLSQEVCKRMLVEA